MTIEELCGKIEWEGGTYEAVVGYGLDETDLDEDVDPEFRELFTNYCKEARKLRELEDDIQDYFDDL